mmetsp:Transcript_63338/g.87491  ORF Transcript_63338/g.87491 Transcript_63338/m.87491 type:complete len:351 (+) Transcript_63338:241-1293(+)
MRGIMHLHSLSLSLSLSLYLSRFSRHILSRSCLSVVVVVVAAAVAVVVEENLHSMTRANHLRILRTRSGIECVLDAALSLLDVLPLVTLGEAYAVLVRGHDVEGRIRQAQGLVAVLRFAHVVDSIVPALENKIQHPESMHAFHVLLRCCEPTLLADCDGFVVHVERCLERLICLFRPRLLGKENRVDEEVPHPLNGLQAALEFEELPPSHHVLQRRLEDFGLFFVVQAIAHRNDLPTDKTLLGDDLGGDERVGSAVLLQSELGLRIRFVCLSGNRRLTVIILVEELRLCLGNCYLHSQWRSCLTQLFQHVLGLAQHVEARLISTETGVDLAELAKARHLVLERLLHEPAP